MKKEFEEQNKKYEEMNKRDSELKDFLMQLDRHNQDLFFQGELKKVNVPHKK